LPPAPAGPQLEPGVRRYGTKGMVPGLSYWLFIALFGFVIIGARVLLAIVVIYLLTPSQRSCVGCDGETITVAAAPGFVRVGQLVRIERRWCTRCGRMTLIRSTGAPHEPRAVAVRASARGARRPHGNGGVTGSR
jgi:hypothetical protein